MSGETRLASRPWPDTGSTVTRSRAPASPLVPSVAAAIAATAATITGVRASVVTVAVLVVIARAIRKPRRRVAIPGTVTAPNPAG